MKSRLPRHWLAATALATVFFFNLCPAARATVTPLSYWRMGDNDPAVAAGPATNTTDPTGGRTMTLNGPVFYTNSVAAAADARTGSAWCLNFSGSGYGTNALVSTQIDNFGIECWVNPNNTTSNECLAYNGSTASSGWGVYKLGATYAGLLGGVTFIGSAPATAGTWTHLALVRNSGTTTFYVNGVASGSTPAAPVTPGGIFGVAADPQNPPFERFHGGLDEVRVFTFAAGAFSTNDLLFTPLPTIVTPQAEIVYATTAGLWASAATSGSFVNIKPAVADTFTAVGFLPGYPMAGLNGKVVFGATGSGSDGVFDAMEGIQLWVTDGTAAGTTEIFSQPDPLAGQPNDPCRFKNFATMGNRVLFEYDDGGGQDILYSTDGTAAGTIQISGQAVDDTSVAPGNGASTGTTIVYATMAGLWASAGTSDSAVNIKPAVADTFTAAGFLPGYPMASLPDGRAVFGATGSGSDGVFDAIEGIQLWVTDGTAAGTTEIFSQPDLLAGQPNDPSRFKNFVTLGNRVLFEYDDGGGQDILYSTDGTAAGTIQISGQAVDDTSVAPGNGASTGTTIVYATTAGLWASAGTSDSAVNIEPTVADTLNTVGFLPGYPMASLPDGRVVFGATGSGSSDPPDMIQGIQLWVTDGTAAGTTKIFSLPDLFAGQPKDPCRFKNFVTLGNRVLFEYDEGGGQDILYSTDGTAAGTIQISGQAVDDTSVGLGNGAITTVPYTLSYTTGTNGTISGTAAQLVYQGASGTPVTAVPNTGYHFVSWSDGVATAMRTDTGVAANLAVFANFALNGPGTFTQPTSITSFSLMNGSNLVVSGTNGQSGDAYYLLQSTNLMLPIRQWNTVGTGVLSADGRFTITYTNVVTGRPQQFYRLSNTNNNP